jgi:hypothetical protein
VVLLIAGVFLVDEAGYSYGDLWVTIGFLGFLVSLVLGVGYYPWAGRRYARRPPPGPGLSLTPAGRSSRAAER